MKAIMITEDYVSFEIAKILKEKKFDVSTRNVYYQFDDGYVDMREYFFSLPNSQNSNDEWACPTLHMTMKWLREIHHIFIQIELYSKYDDYTYEIFQNTHRLLFEKRETFATPEETAEAAIKYCLDNLI